MTATPSSSVALWVAPSSLTLKLAEPTASYHSHPAAQLVEVLVDYPGGG